MSLYNILDQIVGLLRQRQRLTYRLLKREFALNDETLEDLKDELLFSHPVAGRRGPRPGLDWRAICAAAVCTT